MGLAKKFNVKRYSSLIACSVCLLGCAAQIYEVATDFFTNETITKRLLNPQVGVPGISLCISKVCTIGDTCSNNNSQSARNSSLKVYDQLDAINALTINEQREKSATFDQLITRCAVPAAGDTWLSCQQVYNIRKYLTLEDDCYMLTEKNASTSESMKSLPSIDFQRNRPIDIRIYKPLAGRRVDLAFHTRNISWDHFEHAFLKLSPHRYSRTMVSYELIRIESLKSPFKTKCIDYSEQPLKTKGACVATCLIRYYERHLKKWPPQVPALHSSLKFANYKTEVNASELNEFIRLSSSGNFTKTQNVTEYGDIRSRCEHLCDRGVSCVQELFEPFVIAEQQSLLPENDYFDVQVLAPKYIIQFRYEPKTPVIHFICYVGSTTNLWLGISFLALLKFTHAYISQWLTRRKNAKRKRRAAKKGEVDSPEMPAYEKAAVKASGVREDQYTNTYSQPGNYDNW